MFSEIKITPHTKTNAHGKARHDRYVSYNSAQFFVIFSLMIHSHGQIPSSFPCFKAGLATRKLVKAKKSPFQP